jgi:hypothetical protein
MPFAPRGQNTDERGGSRDSPNEGGAVAEVSRQVMIRDWFTVPGISASTLREAFGDRTPSATVEFVVLTVEYYVRAHAPRFYTHDRVLEAMQNRITAANVTDLFVLLEKRGVVEDFFELARTDIDTDGSFRRFLLAIDPQLLDAMRYYAAWNGLSPKLFFDGFVVGVAESFATVVVDLGQLVRLAVRVQQAQLRTAYLMVNDPEAGVQSLREQVGIIRQVFGALLEFLDPTKIPARVLEVWRNWSNEFAGHLNNLDAFAAGRLLGRIGGDLFQLIEGIGELMKLLRVAFRVAARLTPILLRTLRAAAAELTLAVRELAALLIGIGQAVIEALPRVGMGFLRNLFPPELLGQLVTKGRAMLTYAEQWSMVTVFQLSYAEAFGTGAGTRFAVIVSHQGKPQFMAAMSETVSSAGRVATRAEVEEAIPAILEKLDDLPRQAGAPSMARGAEEAAVKAAHSAQLAQRLATQIQDLLQKVAYAAFMELRKRGRVYPNELGSLIHARMAPAIRELVGGATSAVAYTEQELRTVVRTVLASQPELRAVMNGADAALNRTVAQMLLSRDDASFLLKVLGFKGEAAAESEKALASYLAKRFRWKTSTTVGDLRSDLLLVDSEGSRLANVDWTSSTKLDAFEKTWSDVVRDLGTRFDGDWASIAEAYRKGFGKQGVPPDVLSRLQELTTHAVRETLIRQEALRSVFGETWRVVSHEMTYKGLNQLFKDVAEGKLTP